jgi:hypothetical protein
VVSHPKGARPSLLALIISHYVAIGDLNRNIRTQSQPAQTHCSPASLAKPCAPVYVTGTQGQTPATATNQPVVLDTSPKLDKQELQTYPHAKGNGEKRHLCRLSHQTSQLLPTYGYSYMHCHH